MIIGRTSYRLAHKIILSDLNRSKMSFEILNWCFQNTEFFYSSFTYDVLDSLYDIEIICFESYNDAIQFKLIFGGR